MKGVITVNKLDLGFILLMFAVFLLIAATDGPLPAIDCQPVELVQ